MSRTVDLPENSIVTTEIIKHLDDMLHFSPPENLSWSLIKIFMQFVINQHDALPGDFEDIACDLFGLMEFLNHIEKELQEAKVAS